LGGKDLKRPCLRTVRGFIAADAFELAAGEKVQMGDLIAAGPVEDGLSETGARVEVVVVLVGCEV
jgi:hypothetical protein